MGDRTRLGTVRVRTTVVAAAVVGLALIVAAVALVVSLRRSLTGDLEQALELRADDVVAALEVGTAPAALTLDEGEDRFVQILDEAGSVVAASANIARTEPVANLDPGSSRSVTVEIVDDDEREEESYLVFTAVAATSEGALTVYVGRTREFVTESTGFVTGVMAAGLPLLVVFVGATAWWLVGRALGPVESMRREVDRVSDRNLGRRVPVPATDDEIARLAETMNRMLDRLDDAASRQRRFISDAGHELRSPVATLRQYAEVADTHPDRSTVGELAQVILVESERLQRLVDDLLLLARADEGRLSVAREPVDLDDLVFEEAARLREGSELEVDTTGVSAGQIRGDAVRLRRLVRNLGDNAVRHARSRVAFSLREAERGGLTLIVEDDGPGIPEEARERVFERFVRLDEARDRDAGGTGLGLAIVAEVARAHGGSVTVTDSRLGGARFECNLPVPDC